MTADVAAALEREIVKRAIAGARELSADKDLTLGAKGAAFWSGWENALDEVEARIADDHAKLPPLGQQSPEPAGG